MKKYLPKLRFPKGQVILIVLLVISVVLVVGLSVASRSVTDIKISQQSQESARVLWVAQAGLEKAMKANIGLGVTSLGGVQYSVARTDIGGSPEFVFPEKVAADDVEVLWLVEHDPGTGQIKIPLSFYDGNSLTFYWGDPGSAEKPALEATLIYEKAGGYEIKRYTYDPEPGRTPPTSFDGGWTSTGCSCGGRDFTYCSAAGESWPGGGKPYMVRLRLIFNTSFQSLGVKGDKSFPNQGTCFESVATVPESKITRRLRECQSWKVLSETFDFVLFSGGGIQ